MNSETNIKDHALEIYDDETILEIEDKLWWIQGRKEIIRRYLEVLPKTPDQTIIDIGCGSGGNLDVLSEYGKVIGVEVSAKLAEIARKRKIGEIICGDFFKLDVNHSATVYTLFDVLEHIENDKDFIAKTVNTNSKTHYLLISVPAMPSLYSPHDEMLHHHRRYTHGMLRDVLEVNDYEIVSMSYFMSFLLPLIMLSRNYERLMATMGRKQDSVKLGQVPTWLNTILVNVLRFEAFLSSWIRFPRGVWLFALAKYTDEQEQNT